MEAVKSAGMFDVWEEVAPAPKFEWKITFFEPASDQTG